MADDLVPRILEELYVPIRLALDLGADEAQVRECFEAALRDAIEFHRPIVPVDAQTSRAQST